MNDEDVTICGGADFLAERGIADPDEFRVKSHRRKLSPTSTWCITRGPPYLEPVPPNRCFPARFGGWVA